MKTITWKLHLHSSPERVFNFLNSDEGRSRFWAESAKSEHGYILFKFINGQTYKSKITEVISPEILEVDYFNSKARFEISHDGTGGTDLTLINIDVEEHEYHLMYAGWLSILFALKGACDFDIDLRNHDPARTWDQLYIDN